MTYLRIARSTALVACLLPVLTAVGISPAKANSSQCDLGGPYNYFIGYYHNAATRTESFEGVSGYITNRFGAVCDTDKSGPDPATRTIGSNFTTAWVMIADYDATSWPQVGIIRGYGTPQYAWAEVVRDEYAVPYIRFDRFKPGDPTLPDGVRHAYYELWTSGCSCIQSKIDSTVVTQTNFNPYATWSAGPGSTPRWEPQYFGEKTYQASDIMGNTTNHTMFASIGVQRYDNDSLMLEPCTLSYDVTATRASHAANGCYNFDIWTSS